SEALAENVSKPTEEKMESSSRFCINAHNQSDDSEKKSRALKTSTSHTPDGESEKCFNSTEEKSFYIEYQELKRKDGSMHALDLGAHLLNNRPSLISLEIAAREDHKGYTVVKAEAKNVIYSFIEPIKLGGKSNTLML